MNLKLLILILSLLIFFGCNPDDMCLSNQQTVKGSFFSMQNKSQISLLQTSIFGLGMDNDSIYKKESVSDFFLPLMFDKDTTSFVVKNQMLNDTIHFIHTKKIDFISRKCGFTFSFKIDTVNFTGIFIDSVSVINPNIKYNENIKNVEIYIYH